MYTKKYNWGGSVPAINLSQFRLANLPTHSLGPPLVFRVMSVTLSFKTAAIAELLVRQRSSSKMLDPQL